MKLFGAILAGFLSGTAGAMGLGGGSVLLIYLTVFAGMEQLRAQGINLLFFIPIAFVSTVIYAYRGVIVWKKVLIMAAFGIVGTLMGSYLLKFMNPALIQKIFGGLVLLYGIWTLFAKAKKEKSNEN